MIGNDSHPVTRTQQPGDTGTQIVSIKKFNGGTIYTATLDRRATLELKRTVIAESVGRNCGGWGNISTENIWSDDKSCASSGDRGDPKIRHLADNGGYTLTHMPKKDSGLLSAAGHNCKDTDQRGAQRKNADGETGTDTQCDIGAVERGHTPPGRQTPHAIDRRVPEEYNEDISVLKRNISTLQTQKEALQEQIAAKDARIAELEAPDELQVTMGDAGKINRLTLNDDSALKEWETLVKIGDGNNNESGILANTTTHHIRGITGGSKISDGKFEGENGLIHWRATST
ncbi:choice-of-anchor Q domain-containing protein, partial [Thiolapillus sp.]|uniref:choice-of-anchor Q domain-containing protein n=1 Tax=Thiolapillus sp. TaxID=2017437 RepID=UPI003AF78BF5